MLKSRGTLSGHGEGVGNSVPFGGATGTAAPRPRSPAGTALAAFPRLVLIKIGRSELLLDAVFEIQERPVIGLLRPALPGATGTSDS